jgi:hypothetical protein
MKCPSRRWQCRWGEPGVGLGVGGWGLGVGGWGLGFGVWDLDYYHGEQGGHRHEHILAVDVPHLHRAALQQRAVVVGVRCACEVLQFVNAGRGWSLGFGV